MLPLKEAMQFYYAFVVCLYKRILQVNDGSVMGVVTRIALDRVHILDNNKALVVQGE